MNTQPRGLRLLCPQGCGATLTISVPTLAEVHELSCDTSLKRLDTLVDADADTNPSRVVYDQPAPDMITGS
ncbi:MAG: hypothetical protein QOK12_1281 [Mycobacterium sp.]|jgi:hypothetical protein|nr:hypothetical protein [Mycobacterium sp.]